MARLGLSASTAVRSRTIAAAPARVWEVISAPHHQPRWWPGVARVESVDEARFTQVMPTRRGRPVRVDFRMVGHGAPTALVWCQQVDGTPFERVLESSLIRFELAANGEAATTVTVTQVQKLHGSSRGGGLMLRRATGRRLDEALAALAAICESGEPAG